MDSRGSDLNAVMVIERHIPDTSTDRDAPPAGATGLRILTYQCGIASGSGQLLRSSRYSHVIALGRQKIKSVYSAT
jgi:hypothetical protein